MPYCSTGILSLVDVIKHHFTGTSTVLFSEKEKMSSLEFQPSLECFIYFFSEEDYIENVTKDVPRNKLRMSCLIATYL